MIDFVIATVIAIVFVGIAAWIGDWSGAREDRNMDEYWTTYGPKACPACGTPYDDTSREETCSTAGPDGCYFTCPGCGEIAYYSCAEAGPAAFESLEPQWRLCEHCGAENKATPDTPCHTCGSPVGRTSITKKDTL